MIHPWTTTSSVTVTLPEWLESPWALSTGCARSSRSSKVEAKGIERMRDVSEARENVKAEVKRNGIGEMTLGLSAAEGIERARARAETKMRGA